MCWQNATINLIGRCDMLAKYNNLPLNLKTLSILAVILAVSLYPPVLYLHMLYVLKWEMGLPQGLEAMVLFTEQKAMEIFPTKP